MAQGGFTAGQRVTDDDVNMATTLENVVAKGRCKFPRCGNCKCESKKEKKRIEPLVPHSSSAKSDGRLKE